MASSASNCRSRSPTGEVPAFARRFIQSVEWTYAKSVPQHPHEYLVHAKVAPELHADFDRFIELIEQHGFRAHFQAQQYTYLEVDGRRYWASRSLFQPGRNLNRALIRDREQSELPGTQAGQ